MLSGDDADSLAVNSSSGQCAGKEDSDDELDTDIAKAALDTYKPMVPPKPSLQSPVLPLPPAACANKLTAGESTPETTYRHGNAD